MTLTIEQTVDNLAYSGRRRPRRHVRALAEYLATDPRFGDCTLDELTDLIRAGSAVSIPANWAFVQQGQPAHDLYVLITGHAEVYRQRRAVATVQGGDIVGEIAWLRGGGRTATVTSTDTLKALRIDYDGLVPVLERHRALRAVIAGVGAERIGAAA